MHQSLCAKHCRTSWVRESTGDNSLAAFLGLNLHWDYRKFTVAITSPCKPTRHQSAVHRHLRFPLSLAKVLFLFPCGNVKGGWMFESTFSAQEIRFLQSLLMCSIRKQPKQTPFSLRKLIFSLWALISNCGHESNVCPPPRQIHVFLDV